MKGKNEELDIHNRLNLAVELDVMLHLLLQACEDRLISFKVRLARGETSPLSKKSWDGVTLAGFECYIAVNQSRDLV